MQLEPIFALLMTDAECLASNRHNQRSYLTQSLFSDLGLQYENIVHCDNQRATQWPKIICIMRGQNTLMLGSILFVILGHRKLHPLRKCIWQIIKHVNEAYPIYQVKKLLGLADLVSEWGVHRGCRRDDTMRTKSAISPRWRFVDYDSKSDPIWFGTD